MSDEKMHGSGLGDHDEHDHDEHDLYEEVVEEDDAVIGRAFRLSLAALVGVGLLAALGFFLARGTGEAAPEQTFEAAAPEAVEGSAGEVPSLPFRDITEAAGIDFVHYSGAYGDKLLPETMGGGVAFFDHDGDGDQDLLLVNSADWPFAERKADPPPTLALYANDGTGRFRDVTRAVGLDLTLYGMGVAVGDFDGDRDPDLFLSAVGPNVLLRNDGGRFTDVTAEAGVAGAPDEWGVSAAFFDADSDGDLDLFVANYVRWSKEIDFELDFRLTGVGRAYGPPQSYEGTFPFFYRNLGDGRFEDATEAAGLRIANPATGLPMAKSLGVAPVDLDSDGHMDLLVANDTVRNFFFHNRGDGTFTEEGELLGVAYDRNGNATGAMGVDVAHYRNDANLGFVVGNFANEMSSIYVSQDDPEFFVDEAIAEGIGAPSRLALTFAVFFFDADLDGRLDFLQVNGHVENEIATVDPSQSYRQPAQLFWNGGLESGFVQIEAAELGDLAREIVGRGGAYADIDSDGDLDLVLTQVAGPPLLLVNAQATGHHWLRLRLEGRAPNTEAIGAWVELESGGVTQRRQVMPTRSYLSQVELPVTFGLGTADTVDSLTVLWPDGSREKAEVPGVDRLLVVRQEG